MRIDHQYIEEHRVAERYLRRALSADERARFEEHFPDCPECLDRLALAEIFRGGQAETTPRVLSVERPSFPLAVLRQVLRLPPLQKRCAMAIAALLLAGSPLAFVIGLYAGFRTQEAEDNPSRSMLLYPVEYAPAILSYGVAVTDGTGKVVTASTGVRPKNGQSLGIPLAFDHLPPGDYTVTIRAKLVDGTTIPLRTYPIRNQPR